LHGTRRRRREGEKERRREGEKERRRGERVRAKKVYKIISGV
jgi:hypothetical protein